METLGITPDGKIVLVRPRFGPLPSGSLSLGKECPFCLQVTQPGDIPILIEDHPAGRDQLEKKLAGRPYTAVAIIAHWRCVVEYEYKALTKM